LLKRTVSGIMLTLLLIGMLALVFDVQPVKASGTIYIRADGSISPSTSNITSTDNVTYYFTDNNHDSIVVERDNIIVDGAGYTLEGAAAPWGIYLSQRQNVTIKNMEIKAFMHGIVVGFSSNGNIVSGNKFTANNYDGIVVTESSNNTISGNNVTNNGLGIRLAESSSNSISGNNITANDEGGIYLGYSSNSNNIHENKITANNYDGIWLGESSSNSIYGNNITANEWSGILLYTSSYNTIYRNNITNNGLGIRLENHPMISGDSPSNYNSIYGNNITANKLYGVDILSSSYNTIYGNNITNNGMGIRLEFSNSNSIYGNNITANKLYGVDILSSSNNIIYHNNFANNTNQVYAGDYVNVWTYSYLSGGNYWSDYNGIDLYSGPYQNETGSDGLGDTPYVINAKNTDNYPLMQPYRGPVRNLNTGQSYPTIEEGINNASEGDAIFVGPGKYYGNITVDKSISLIGEDKNTTIIDGENKGSVIYVESPCTISGFTIRNARDYGIYVDLVGGGSNFSFNIIEDCHIGVHLEGSSENIVSANSISAVQSGVSIYGYAISGYNNTIIGNTLFNNIWGIILDDAYNNMIENNLLFNNSYGIFLDGSLDNVICANTVIDSKTCGVCLYYPSSGNSIYHNNFINNPTQAGSSFINAWDDGYPSGGNYWSDHNPPDVYSGPYQNETGRDKIGDIPYVIDGNNTDRYPLIYPYGRVSSADLNDDGIVNILDAIRLMNAFGSKPGDVCMPCWDPKADINQDGKVNILDAIILASHFGETV